ncbi:MAG: TonB-dependent receptor [Alphaproteobacteria bacterium]|nr:TonB-dependent receptor [Alphaproteobacteria bacterium]
MGEGDAPADETPPASAETPPASAETPPPSDESPPPSGESPPPADAPPPPGPDAPPPTELDPPPTDSPEPGAPAALPQPGAPAALPTPEPGPASGAPPPEDDGTTLPQVRLAPPPPYPESAREAGLEGSVLLELALSELGLVLDASVLQSSDPVFEGSALEAAFGLQFTPALDADGRAVPMVLQYRMLFSLDVVATVGVEGVVRQAGTRDPVVGATIVATPFVLVTDGAPAEEGAGEEGPGEEGAGEEGAGEEGAGEEGAGEAGAAEAPDAEVVLREDAAVTVSTDADGRFVLAGLDPGSWQVVASSPGFEADPLDVEVAAGEVVSLTFWLAPLRPWESTSADETMEIIGFRLPPEITERRLDASQVRYMPGTGGDIVRAVQTQPGVARTPFSTGALLVRGTPSDASGFYLGGARLPLVFHFGGLSTVLPSDLLDEVRFLPGTYGVRYGRHLGGVVDLIPRAELAERSHGKASLDLFQASVFHTQKLSDHWTLTGAIRRSYIDAILGPLVNIDPSYSLRLPAFTDGQLRGLYVDDRGSSVDLMALFSDDRFTFTELDGDGDNTTSKIRSGFVKGRVGWNHVLGKGWESELSFMAGPEATQAEYQGSQEAYEQIQREQLRFEVTRPVPEGGVVGWRMGMDFESSREDFKYALDDLDGFFPYADPEEGDVRVLRPGLYLEQTQSIGWLQGTPGVRIDWMSTDEGWFALTVDPRFRMRAELPNGTVLNGGVGRYSQFPLLRETLESSNGNPDLGPESAIQLSVGAQHEFFPGLSLEGTIYYSALSQLVVGLDNRFTFELAPPPMAPYDTDPYDNEGTGKAYGLELLSRYEDKRTFAFVALTLSRATRIEREGQEPGLFQYDQPVMLTLSGSRVLPRGWRAGGRFRLTSGNPYTPIVNSFYDLDEQTWLPVFAESNVARMPTWWALDVRVDKQWTYRTWALTLYFDIQNITNRRNVELLNFSPDYSLEIPVYGLPILPAFGLEAQW